MLIPETIKKCRTFLLDCDGVIWRGNNTLLEAEKAVKLLKNMGINVGYVTNNSGMTRNNFVKKLQSLGFEVQENECFCTSFLTGKYLKEIELKLGVFVVGASGLAEELRIHGHNAYRVEDTPNIRDRKDIGAVVVGLDQNFTYEKIDIALNFLKNKSVIFIGTNTDSSIPTEHGRVRPGAGSMISAISTACGRKATILGKPSEMIFETIKKELNCDIETTCMVGDRIETDIKFGKNCQMKTMLVYSGVTSKEDYEKLKKEFEEKNIENFCLADFEYESFSKFVNDLINDI